MSEVTASTAQFSLVSYISSNPDHHRGVLTLDTKEPTTGALLTLGVNVQQGTRSLSWTGSGVLIPCEEKAADVFARLFLQGSPAETAASALVGQQPKALFAARITAVMVDGSASLNSPTLVQVPSGSC